MSPTGPPAGPPATTPAGPPAPRAHVVATAGHVDHGKSSLVRALTGTDPDRWAEEKRRGLTLDLGFAWTELPGAGTVAFVDVPGHERFVPTMLAGVGPVPVALLVVAADGGWMPQSAEHLAALDALDVRHGLLVVTRADLADPAPATERALAEAARTSLGALPAVACSVVTGQGLDDVRTALAAVLRGVPAPDPAAPVRFWVDRSFTVRGAGTVVTGTLAAGTLRVGDELDQVGAGTGAARVRVRGLQSTGRDAAAVGGSARVALNLRGVERGDVGRGDALLTPGAFRRTAVLDVRRRGGGEETPPEPLPEHLVAHVGSAAVGARVRPLGDDARHVRLHLDRPLPLRVGDRLLLREPARHAVLGAGLVLDVAPPALRRRGAAAARAAVLAGLSGVPDEVSELRRRGLVRGRDLRAFGVVPATTPVAGDWHADPERWEALRRRLSEVVAEHRRANPLQPGPALEEVRRALRLPERALVDALLVPPLRVLDGRVTDRAAGPDLPPAVRRAVDAVLADLAADPFAAPDAERLRALGLGRSELAAAVRAGALDRVGEQVVLAPGARRLALERLRPLPAPFTAADARRAWGTSRRVALPLLEALDRDRATLREVDDRRRLAP